MAFVLCFLWVRKNLKDVFSLPSRSQGENALDRFRTPVLGRRKLLRDVFSVFSRSCFPEVVIMLSFMREISRRMRYVDLSVYLYPSVILGVC